MKVYICNSCLQKYIGAGKFQQFMTDFCIKYNSNFNGATHCGVCGYILVMSKGHGISSLLNRPQLPIERSPLFRQPIYKFKLEYEQDII